MMDNSLLDKRARRGNRAKMLFGGKILEFVTRDWDAKQAIVHFVRKLRSKEVPQIGTRRKLGFNFSLLFFLPVWTLSISQSGLGAINVERLAWDGSLDTTETPAADSQPIQPSFDCGKAASEVEKLICGSKELREKDATLGRLYAKALMKNAISATAIRAAQIEWWKNREACAKRPTSMLSCVNNAYSDRLSQLMERSTDDRLQSGGQPGPSPTTGNTELPQLQQHFGRPIKQFKQDPQGFAFLIAVIRDDVETYFNGGQSLFTYGFSQRIMENVSAPLLLKDYNNNEISADNKYKDRQFIVEGTIADVRKDFLGNSYVDLASTDLAAFNVHAELASDAVSEAGSYEPGQQIQLVCTGAGMSIGSPILSGCRSQRLTISNTSRIIEAQLKTWISTGDIPQLLTSPKLDNAEIAFTLFVGYWIGLEVPESMRCHISFSVFCKDRFAQIVKNLKANEEFRTAYTTAPDYLNLPSLEQQRLFR